MHSPWIPKDKPINVLFILTDQQRFDTLAVQGKVGMHTPNMDRLCQEGTYFHRAYASQALCSPSRASIFSGLYPHTHRVQENIYGIDDVTSMSEYNMSITWPLLLQREGYRTCYIGKWHLGEKGPKCFDEWFGFNSLLSHWMGEYEASEYRSDVETDIGIEFIERNRTKPFLLCQSYYPPHTPYTAPEEHTIQYRGKLGFEPAEYYGAITDIDMNIGRLLKKLEDTALLERTLIIFTSDHGEHFGRRPGGGNKRAAYDDSARIPLILRLPGIFDGGRVKTELVSNVDIMPTVLEVVGIDIPRFIQGRSLVPLCLGGAINWRTAVCIENKEDLQDNGFVEGGCDSRAVVTDTHKLILREKLSIRAKTLRELYDLENDSGENTNIYGLTEATRIRSMLDELDDWAKATDDELGQRLAKACRVDLGIDTATSIAKY